MKNKYDTSVVFLYSIGKEYLLPYQFRKQIPYSTIADWRKKDDSQYLGHEFRCFFDQAFSSAELNFRHDNLKKTMMSLARSWITLSYMIAPIVKSATGDKKNQASILNSINYIKVHLLLHK